VQPAGAAEKEGMVCWSTCWLWGFVWPKSLWSACLLSAPLIGRKIWLEKLDLLACDFVEVDVLQRSKHFLARGPVCKINTHRTQASTDVVVSVSICSYRDHANHSPAQTQYGGGVAGTASGSLCRRGFRCSNECM